jgi:large subunit ribosomal protein L15
MCGTHKNRRGKGSRGGKGWAGSQKHHAQLAREAGRAQGKYGFKRPQQMVYGTNTINVGALDQTLPIWVKSGKATESDGIFTVDLDSLQYDKLLGSGRVTRKVVVSVESCSESAKTKIEKTGGSVNTVSAKWMDT